RISGEPGIDCHSTWILFCLPQSTKTLPTASSVTVFQLAENQTLNLPETIVRSLVGVAPAAATAVACGAAPPAGAVAAWPPAAGLVGRAAGPPQAASSVAPASAAAPLRNCRRDKGTARRCSSMVPTSPTRSRHGPVQPRKTSAAPLGRAGVGAVTLR